MRNKNSKTAFSIIELSIAVLIISFILGGVVAANRMSTNAKLVTAQSLTKYSPVSDIPGLTLWLETTMPQSFADITADDGKTVTTWFDLGPNKTNITGSAIYKANILNGLPVLSFNGSQTMAVSNIKITDLVQRNQGSIFIVQNYITGSSSTIFWGGSGNNRMSTHALYGAGGTLYFDFGNCCGADARSTTIPSNFGYKNNIITLIKYPTSAIIVINGGTPVPNVSANGAINDDTAGTFTVGTGYTGIISEIIIFDRALSDVEKKDVEQYLSKKWGITIS